MTVSLRPKVPEDLQAGEPNATSAQANHPDICSGSTFATAFRFVLWHGLNYTAFISSCQTLFFSFFICMIFDTERRAHPAHARY